MVRLRSDSPFGECPRRHYCSKGAGRGWVSGFFSGKSKEERTQDDSVPAGGGKGTRQDGSNYYQAEVLNKKNGFRVERGEQGEKRIGYRTKDGYVTKRFNDE